jgi:hypothetical protein
MAQVIPGRYTAQMEGTFVVFMIGMRINKLWAVHKWLPVMQAMPRMLKELYQNRSLGFLSASYFITLRGITVLQYWNSFEQLEHYARHGAIHLKAWREFNQKIGTSGTVGIYHESYIIDEGKQETFYNNMPVCGLAQAGKHVPVTTRTESARERLNGKSAAASESAKHEVGPAPNVD